MNQAIRVLVVDDSPFVCRLLTAHLQAAPGMTVVGTALGGARALELVAELRPDVVTLDLEMPGLKGLDVLERIMHAWPTPVIMVSGLSRRAADATLQAIQRGAVDFVLKYTAGSDTDPELLWHEIVSKVRLAAGIKVIRSLNGSRPRSEDDCEVRRPSIALRETVGAAQPAHARTVPAPFASARPASAPVLGGVVVIGASTGGPLALRELLAQLPANFPTAVLIVQHIPASFTRVLAAQLDRQVALTVKEAAHGDRLRPGNVLVAPGEQHLLIGPDACVQLVRGPRIGGHCPSIDVTMQSVAQVFGPRARGVVLTGMGSDGALGLVAIQARGGQTFAQDAASCVVNGMPQQAIDRGAVDYVASPAQIAGMLQTTRVWSWEKQSW